MQITRALAFGLALCLAAPALAQSTNITTTNSSVVIATGNTFQTVLAAQSGTTPRRALTIENNNATDSCWISFGSGITAGNATKGKSILLTPGGSYSRYSPYVPGDEIEGTCASNSDTLYVELQ